MHVVPHTHWDREWYATFQDFRMRLVRMMDRLLDVLEADPGYRCFLWDAQTVVVEDYLEIRPEAAERLRRQIAAGRIEIGPWYVQPDESLISGESYVRNFLLARHIVRQQGAPGEGVRVGYLPDMFGHISQMPQLLRGFGIDTALLWRGISGVEPEWTWRAPDGSEVLALHLPDRTGYSMVHHLASDPAEALRQIEGLAPDLDPDSRTDVRLLLVGSDHVEPQSNLPALLAAVRALEGAPAELVQSGLGAYVEHVRQDLRRQGLLPVDWSQQGGGAGLGSRTGELRDTNRSPRGGFNFVLPNVLSSRMPLKLRNAETERELTAWAEPLSALARLGGAPAAHAFLRRAWSHLLQNQPHDSIGGCSRDEVHRAMPGRFDAAMEIAQQITAESAARLAMQIDTSALPEPGRVAMVVNPMPTRWQGAVELRVDLPHSAWRDLEVIGPDGASVAAQVVERRDVFRTRSMPEPGLFPVVVANPGAAPGPESGWFTAFEGCQEVHLRVVADVPGLGYSTYRIRQVQRGRVQRGSVRTGPLSADNGLLGIELSPEGRVTLRQGGRVWEDVLHLEDGGDSGDGYTYSPPPEDSVLTWHPRSVGIAEDGPAAVRFFLEGDFALPAALAPGRRRRAEDRVANPVRIDLTLSVGSPLVDVLVRSTNRSRDHRLRLLVPTGLRTAKSRAQVQWDIAERPTTVEHPAEAVWIEDAPSCHPTHGFVDAVEGEGGPGFAVVGLGLPEYELTPRGELALTLVRAFGHLGSPDPLTIINGAGPGVPTPDAQLLEQTLELRAALVPHGPGADLWPLARAWQHPCRAFPQTRHRGTLPLAGSWIQTPAGVDVSALKEAEDGDGVILRLFNPGSEARGGAVGIGLPVRSAEKVRLDETACGDVPLDAQGRAPVQVTPRALHSLRLRP